MNDLMLETREKKCRFCGSANKNEFKFGPMYRLGNITAHYFCVLLSNQLVQRGDDTEGMLGFLLCDIQNILENSKHIKCSYCRNGHATLKCCKPTCKKIYHYKCAYDNGALFQFFGFFKNFCLKHRPQQNIPGKYLPRFSNNSLLCSICFGTIREKNLLKILWAPCCKKSWFHRSCIQKLALSMGYLFKCAICNDQKKFRNYMQRYGIYIPDKDASWELVPNAFEELLFKYSRCDANECKCPEGRQKDLEETMWEIILCRSCGSHGIHIACGRLKFIDPVWECKICEKVSNRRDVSQENTANSEPSVPTIKSKEDLKVVPSSSKGIIRNTFWVKSTRKKRDISEITMENARVIKRIKYDGDRKESEGETRNVEIIGTLNDQNAGRANETTHTPVPVHSPKDLDVDIIQDESISMESDQEIVIDSSDSDCKTIEVVEISDDEIEVIVEDIKNPRAEAKIEKEKERYQTGGSSNGGRYVAGLSSYLFNFFTLAASLHCRVNDVVGKKKRPDAGSSTRERSSIHVYNDGNDKIELEEVSISEWRYEKNKRKRRSEIEIPAMKDSAVASPKKSSFQRCLKMAKT